MKITIKTRKKTITWNSKKCKLLNLIYFLIPLAAIMLNGFIIKFI